MQYRYRKVLSRRTMLRGAGTVAIALPFLDEMRATSVYAAAPEPSARALTIFFGEGVPVAALNEYLPDLSGPFTPLARHQAKLGFIRGLDHPDGHHYGGGASCFTGTGQLGGGGLNGSGTRTVGPSFDQVMRTELYPRGLPAGVQGTTSMGLVGTYTPTNGAPPVRYVKCWDYEGNPAAVPKLSPAALFDTVFGAAGQEEETAAQQKLRRRRQSILDSVVGQYEHLMSDASNLGKPSRARISDHLERVYEYEQRAFGEFEAACEPPADPGNLALLNGQDNFAGVIFSPQQFLAYWRSLADIYALAFQCDLLRFGNAHMLNVGDRINFQGPYSYGGDLIYDFDDAGERSETEVSEQVNHEFFHDWMSASSPAQARHHLHMYMDNVSYLLTALDNAEYPDENGGTILDNAMVMISTELSDPGPHSVTDVFHAYSSANGRFRIGEGQISPGDQPSVHFYNTVLEAYGIDYRLGSGSYNRVDEVLA